jgi:uncharacterized membrane protein YhaH (DUF805 family)
MNFWQAIKSGFSNYVAFSGRSARSEFWYWCLFYLLAAMVTAIIDDAIGVQVTVSLFGLAALLPTIAVNVRRLHDIDRSGWWFLLNLLPIIGAIIMIVWFCARGTVGPNRFGPDPLEGSDFVSPHPAA